MKALRLLLLTLCCVLPALPSVSVQAAEPVAKKQAKPAVKPASKAAAKPVAKPVGKAPAKAPAKARPKVQAKPRAKAGKVSKVAAKPVPKAKLDLSLPKSMVNQLEPDVGDAPVVRKPLLPSMFPTKAESDSSPFQLNGRLISNEMQLQLRNDSRREVEGAAIDFEFRN